jgi:hypothetical protein
METFADIFKRVYSKPDVTLSTGAVVKHRPMLVGGLPNGATDAYLIDNRPMIYAEFLEYNELTKGN